MEKQVRLCWTSHQGTIQGYSKSFLARKKFLDVILSADDVDLPAHKFMLSACSPYFERILLRFDLSKKTPVIILPPGAKGSELKALIHFIYNGEVSIPQSQYDSFLKLAQFLKIRGLTIPPVNPSNGNNLGPDILVFNDDLAGNLNNGNTDVPGSSGGDIEERQVTAVTQSNPNDVLPRPSTSASVNQQEQQAQDEPSKRLRVQETPSDLARYASVSLVSLESFSCNTTQNQSLSSDEDEFQDANECDASRRFKNPQTVEMRHICFYENPAQKLKLQVEGMELEFEEERLPAGPEDEEDDVTEEDDDEEDEGNVVEADVTATVNEDVAPNKNLAGISGQGEDDVTSTACSSEDERMDVTVTSSTIDSDSSSEDESMDVTDTDKGNTAGGSAKATTTTSIANDLGDTPKRLGNVEGAMIPGNGGRRRIDVRNSGPSTSAAAYRNVSKPRRGINNIYAKMQKALATLGKAQSKRKGKNVDHSDSGKGSTEPPDGLAAQDTHGEAAGGQRSQKKATTDSEDDGVESYEGHGTGVIETENNENGNVSGTPSRANEVVVAGGEREGETTPNGGADAENGDGVVESSNGIMRTPEEQTVGNADGDTPNLGLPMTPNTRLARERQMTIARLCRSRKFRCYNCSRAWNRNSDLERHKNYKYKCEGVDKPQYFCKKCKCQFKTKPELMKHQKYCKKPKSPTGQSMRIGMQQSIQSIQSSKNQTNRP